MRIVLCYPVEPRHIEQIQAAAPEAEVVDAGQERINEELLQADIFIGHAKVPVDWERVVRNRAVNLSVLSSRAASRTPGNPRDLRSVRPSVRCKAG